MPENYNFILSDQQLLVPRKHKTKKNSFIEIVLKGRIVMTWNLKKNISNETELTLNHDLGVLDKWSKKIVRV